MKIFVALDPLANIRCRMKRYIRVTVFVFRVNDM